MLVIVGWLMRQSPPLFKYNSYMLLLCDPEPAPSCRQQFGEILYSAKTDLVPNIAPLGVGVLILFGFYFNFRVPPESWIL